MNQRGLFEGPETSAPTADPPRFDGPEYEPSRDRERLAGQLFRIHELMRDGAWRTLEEISVATGAPAASASAQLRHLRKQRFGAHVVERRPRGDRSHGLFEYAVRCGDEP